jgi:hypothetical protein
VDTAGLPSRSARGSENDVREKRSSLFLGFDLLASINARCFNQGVVWLARLRHKKRLAWGEAPKANYFTKARVMGKEVINRDHDSEATGASQCTRFDGSR